MQYQQQSNNYKYQSQPNNPYYNQQYQQPNFNYQQNYQENQYQQGYQAPYQPPTYQPNNNYNSNRNSWGQAQNNQNASPYIYQQPKQQQEQISYIDPSDQPYKQNNFSQQQNIPRNQYSGNNKSFKWGVSGGSGLQLNDRLPFIRKVYALIIMQLLFTIFLCILSFTSESFRNFQLVAFPIVIFCILICLAIEIVVFCYPQHAWKVPRNYILLAIYTICMGYIVSHLCSYVYWKHSEDGAYAVLMAAGLTLAAVIGLTIYACYTKSDFTTKGSALFMFSFSLLIFFIFALIFQSKVLFLFYSLLCCILFGLYLIYDTQLIIGGKVSEYNQQ